MPLTLLAYLGSPSAIEPIDSLLTSENAEVISTALSAASILGCADNFEAILHVAKTAHELYAMDLYIPLSDYALGILSAKMGLDIPIHEYDDEKSLTDFVLTKHARDVAIEYFQQESHTFKKITSIF